jgi:hypothetical protein
MKKFLYILFFFLPVVVSAQFNLYKSSPLDNIWHDVGNPFFTMGHAAPIRLAFSPSNGELYIAYAGSGPSYKATVMKFDGTNWVYIGNAGFSSEFAFDQSFAISPSGEPFLAYEDYENSHKSTVMKFDGTNWVIVGNAGFSSGSVYDISFAFSPSGQPYIAYLDGSVSSKTTVMKFDANNWVNVGNAGFSEGLPSYICLAFNPSDSLPYVAFVDLLYPINYDSVPKLTLMKFDGSNWVYIGNRRFAESRTEYLSLAFNNSGQPYVAFSDHTQWPNTGTVMTFDGTNWAIVGKKNFSMYYADYVSLACSPSGEPFVAYSDGENAGRASVKRFNGTNWVYVGIPGFSSDVAVFTSLAFSPSGQPYVGSADSANSWKATVMKYDSAYIGFSEKQESRLSLYPNPTTGKIIIETSATLTKSHLSIINLSGQEFITRQITELKTKIDISNLPSGVYFVRLTNVKTVEVEKFVKQ